MRTVVLKAPLVLVTGARLENQRLLLADDFAWSSQMAAIYIGDAEDVAISNVELIGSPSWRTRWNAYHEGPKAPPGIVSGMCGIRAQKVPKLRIEGCTIEGFPRGAIESFGIPDSVIEEVEVTRCFHAVGVYQYAPTARLRIERVSSRDCWGPPNGSWPGIENLPSVVHPGATMGSTQLQLMELTNSEITNCEAVGEGFASLKLINPQRCTVKNFKGGCGMVQGTTDLTWDVDKEPSRDTLFESCVFDKSLCAGKAVEGANGFQISWNVHSLRIRSCVFRSGGKNGHGVQIVGPAAHPTFVDCTFQGWNGTRGTGPAYACETREGGSVNGDFAAMNYFLEQERILLQS